MTNPIEEYLQVHLGITFAPGTCRCRDPDCPQLGWDGILCDLHKTRELLKCWTLSYTDPSTRVVILNQTNKLEDTTCIECLKLVETKKDRMKYNDTSKRYFLK